jgi:hypothetical protein
MLNPDTEEIILKSIDENLVKMDKLIANAMDEDRILRNERDKYAKDAAKFRKALVDLCVSLVNNKSLIYKISDEELLDLASKLMYDNS